MKRLAPAHSISALALVGLLALTGCSDSGDKDDPSSDSKTAKLSPLDEFYDDLYSTQTEESMNQQQKEQEELVASCMVEKGFSYIPQDFSAHTSFVTAEDMEDQNTREWVATNGYGMFTMMEPTEDPGDGESSEDAWVDPNQDYIDSLSESGQEAYWAALYGEQVEYDETTDEVPEYDWTTAGCQGYASHELWGEQEDLTTEFQPLMDAMNELWDAQQNDPKIKALEPAWSTCMADAGFTFKNPDEALQSVTDAGNALWAWDENTDPEDPPAEPSSKEIDDVKALEIKTALADFTCKEEVSWDETTDEVRFALEEQFIKDHKTELEAYKEAVKQAM